MTTIIDLNDLRHSINRALNLGRYTIAVKTAGAEQVPASITLDLLERDDDGFKWPWDTEAFPEGLPKTGVLSRKWAEEQVRRATETAVSIATDDHTADPMPPVGPLTSTEGLKAGDVVAFQKAESGWQAEYEEGSEWIVKDTSGEGTVTIHNPACDAEGEDSWSASYFRFVRRPVDTPPASSDT